MSIYDSGPFAPHERVTSKELLVAAKALIEDPENWIKGSSIETRNGHDCFCSSGALERACIESGMSRFSRTRRDAVQALSSAVPDYLHFVSFNDDTLVEHPDVMAMFDRAIASLK